MDQRLVNGTQLDTFRIVRLIGKGGMGEVYEAYEDLLNRKVALKIIAIDTPPNQQNTSKTTGQQEAIRSFISEGQALAKLNHPNVVTIYRLGVSQGIHYIAMEYVEGRSLKTLISKGEVDLQYAIQIFDKIVSGTRALHEKNIIHRDLKPKNILISKDKTIKIVDFGISETHKEDKAVNTTGKIVGSVFYIPPEVIRGLPATLKSDIWNIGVILFEMLTGEKPFYGDTPEEILKKVREKDVAFPLTKRMFIPDVLQKLVLKMCARNPDERFQSIEEVHKDFRSIVMNLKSGQVAPRQTTGQISSTTKSNLKVKTATQSPSSAPVASQNPPKSRLGIAISLVLILSGLTWWLSTHKTEIKWAKNIIKNEPKETVNDRKPVEIQPTPAPVTQVAQIEVENIKNPASSPELTKESDRSIASEPKNEPDISQPIPTATTPKAIKDEKAPVAIRPIKMTQVKLVKPKLNVVLRFDNKILGRDIASIQKGLKNAPLLAWNRVKGAREYLVEVSKTLSFDSVIEENRTSGTNFKFVPTSSGKYYWRVKAISDNGNEGAFSRPGEVAVSLPSPQLQKSDFKLNDKNSAQGVNLEWGTVPFASEYKVEVATDANFKKTIVEEVVRDEKFQFVPQKPGKYFARILALNSERAPASLPSKSATIELSKPDLLPAPELSTPLEGIRVPNQGAIATPVVFAWQSIKGASGYLIQLARTKDFSALVFEKSVSQPEFVFTEQLSPGPVYWRVRAESKGRDANWSLPRTFVLD